MQVSGSTRATYSPRNMTGIPWVSVVFMAMQPARSQLQMPPMNGRDERPDGVAEPFLFVLPHQGQGFFLGQRTRARRSAVR